MTARHRQLTTGIADFGEPRFVPTLRILRWRALAAIHSSGSLLLGPHREGAQAIVPPGAFIRMPLNREGFPEDREYSEEGWRVAIWIFTDIDDGSIDARRPHKLFQTGIVDVTQRIRFETPEHEPWIRDEIRQRGLSLRMLLEHASSPADDLASYRSELDDLLIDSSELFDSNWVHEQIMLD